MNGSTPVDEKTSAGEPRGGSAGEPLVVSQGDTRRGAAGAPPVGARLNVAALRRAVPIRMWGGKGSGLPCDFCRVLVGPEDVEYEVEAQLDGATLMLRFHYRCHYAWTGGEEPLVAADRA